MLFPPFSSFWQSYPHVFTSTQVEGISRQHVPTPVCCCLQSCSGFKRSDVLLACFYLAPLPMGCGTGRDAGGHVELSSSLPCHLAKQLILWKKARSWGPEWFQQVQHKPSLGWHHPGPGTAPGVRPPETLRVFVLQPSIDPSHMHMLQTLLWWSDNRNCPFTFISIVRDWIKGCTHSLLQLHILV